MRKLQSVFNQVVNHLHKQGKQAYSDVYDSCLYLTEDGKRCAVGCLLEIPENQQKEAIHFDNAGLEKLKETYPNWLPKNIDFNNRIMNSMLQMMQDVHDCASNWFDRHAMDESLAYVADRFQLKYTPPKHSNVEDRTHGNSN